ncbi:MAG TPA: lytic transglycosylase domain-containing protein [Rhizobiaceae bacterium]|nr:lytic transglycosylase domain-containing protein [Rhizobiaceae bacterium]
MTKARQPSLIVAGAVLAAVPLAMSGEAVSMPDLGPNLRPNAYVGQPVDKSAITSALSARFGLLDGGVSEFGRIAILKAGLDALAKGEAADAVKIRDGLDGKSLDRRILTWALAMDGALASHELDAVVRDMADWPGADTLRKNRERAVSREKLAPKDFIALFSDAPPETVQGTIALARAHVLLGDKPAARAALSKLWRFEKLEATDEQRIIKEFGDVLTTADHRVRMEKMLYEERVRSAERVAKLAEAPSLAKAWAAVLRGDKNARKLLDAVPAAERSAGYAFAEAKYLRRKKDFAAAANVMLKAPTGAEALVDPDEWWVDRRVLSRELVDHGDIKTAYKLAAAHSAESPTSAADAEFHAGWYALRGLNDPATAAKHFTRIAELAEGPITLSRAYYWLGRAAEAGGPGDSKSYYEKAAAYGTAFYGQLAAVKLGRIIEVKAPEPTISDRVTFERREAVQAIRRLERTGHATLAGQLYRELARQLEAPGEFTLLVAMVAGRGDHYSALRLAKLGASRGLDIGALTHPVGAIPQTAEISTAGEALAYAIARQESEFNVGAVSHAGALGLLQLLPGTAQDVAKKAGLPYSKARLTTDAGYNATLGASFLSEQLGRFTGSYVLTFAGYNAGPRRAQEWVKRYGDPRGKDLDTVVDWIERIPFTETRSYVQRVMENYQVYKTRLSGEFNLADDLVKGR